MKIEFNKGEIAMQRYKKGFFYIAVCGKQNGDTEYERWQGWTFEKKNENDITVKFGLRKHYNRWEITELSTGMLITGSIFASRDEAYEFITEEILDKIVAKINDPKYENIRKEVAQKYEQNT